MGKLKQKFATPLLQLYDINKNFVCNLTNRTLRNSAYSIKNKLSFRELSKSSQGIKEVQETLMQQGAYLPDFDLPTDESKHWAYKGLAFIRSKGLVSGGYENEYGLNKQVNGAQFRNLFNNTLIRSNIEVDNEFIMENEKVLTAEQGAEILVRYLKLELEENKSAIEVLKNHQIIDSETAEHLIKEEVLTRAGAFMLLHGMVSWESI